MDEPLVLGDDAAVVDGREAGGKEGGEDAQADERALLFVDGQVAHEAARLPVHGKEELLAFPGGAEHPDGHERVDRVCPFLLDVAALAGHGVVALDARAQSLLDARVDSLLGAVAAGFGVLVVAVGDETGHVGDREGHERLVVVGLDGVHVRVGHLCGTVDGDAGEGHGAVALDRVVVGLDDLVVALVVGARVRRLKDGAAGGLGVIEPEGHVDALNLVDAVAAGEALRQQDLALIVLGQGLLGGLVVEFEGNHELGPEIAGKAIGRDHGVAAVGALGDGGARIADELGPTGRAHVGAVEAGRVAGRGGGRFLGLLLSRLLLGRVAGLDVRYGELGVAVVADEQGLRAVVAQRAAACRALIVDALHAHGPPPSLCFRGGAC